MTSSEMALGVYQFTGFEDAPSALYRVNLHTADKTKIYSGTGLTITDVRMIPDGKLLAVGIQEPGRLKDTPIPGKVRVAFSDDSKTWADMAVDYRAVAREAFLAGADLQHMFLATDTGMILKLVDSARDQNRP